MKTRARLASGVVLTGMLIGGSLAAGPALIHAEKGGGHGQAGAHGQNGQGAQGHGHRAGKAAGKGVTLTGYLASDPAAAPSGTLTVDTNRGQIAVQVTATTRFLGGHDGLSGMGDLLPSDHLQIAGQWAGAQTVVAALIRDLSVGSGDTVLAATVTGVVTSSPQTVTVLPRARGRHAAFMGGQTSFTLPISATTVIIAGGVAKQGDDSALKQGDLVTVVGVFDRHSRGFVATKRIAVRGDKGGEADEDETRTTSTTTSSGTPTGTTSTVSVTSFTTSTSTVTTLSTTTVTVGTTTTSTTTVGTTVTGTTSTGTSSTGTTSTGTTSATSTTSTTTTGTTSAQGVFVQVSGIVDKVTITGTNSATVSVHLLGNIVADLPVTASTTITVGSGATPGTIADLHAGKFVVALAGYDAASNTYTSVSSINVEK